MGRLLGASISQFGLKLIASACMLLYVISVTVLQYGILRLDETDSQTLLQAMAGGSSTMGTATLAVIFELLAGAAITIFSFLLVEGFEKTSSFRTYFASIMIFALLSEVPYDFSRSRVFFDFSGQNPMFALAVGLIMLYGIRMVQKDYKKHILVCGCILIAALAWCLLLHVEFGVFTVLAIFVYYFYRDSHGFRIFLGVIVTLPVITGLLTVYPLFIYSGKRGIAYNKYLFYIIYPLSLVICSFICTQIR